MKYLIIGLLFALSFNVSAQQKNKSNYTIIHNEQGVVDIVMNVPNSRENIKRAIKSLCQKYKDDKTSIGVWKSKQYYKSTGGNGKMIASYIPMMDEQGVWNYFLTFPDNPTYDENKSANGY